MDNTGKCKIVNKQFPFQSVITRRSSRKNLPKYLALKTEKRIYYCDLIKKNFLRRKTYVNFY